MKKRSAIKNDLFASEHHREKIDRIGDPLAEIEQHINFSALAAEVDCIAPRGFWCTHRALASGAAAGLGGSTP